MPTMLAQFRLALTKEAPPRDLQSTSGARSILFDSELAVDLVALADEDQSDGGRHNHDQ